MPSIDRTTIIAFAIALCSCAKTPPDFQRSGPGSTAQLGLINYSYNGGGDVEGASESSDEGNKALVLTNPKQ